MRVFALALLALAACGQAPTQPPAAPAAASNEYTLTCANFATLTPATLADRYGAENISTQTLPGAEGESYEATVVFSDDAARRMVIVWNDAGNAAASASVVNEGTRWRGAEGYTIGTPIADVERLNVMPFKLWGFGWDYGGWVSEWNAGVLAQNPICRTRVRFTPRGPENLAAMGDSEFNSNDPAIRSADPVISEFGLMIGSTDAG